MMLKPIKYSEGKSGKWTVWNTYLVTKYEPRLRDADIVSALRYDLPLCMSLRASVAKQSLDLVKNLYGKFDEVML